MEALSSHYRHSEQLPPKQQPLPTSGQQGNSSGGGGGNHSVLPIHALARNDGSGPTLASLLDTGHRNGPIASHLRGDLQRLYALGGPRPVLATSQQLERSRATIESTANRIFHFEAPGNNALTPPFAALAAVGPPQAVAGESDSDGNALSAASAESSSQTSGEASGRTDDGNEGGHVSPPISAGSGAPAPQTGSWASASTVIFAKAGEILPNLKGQVVTWRLGIA